jgi:phosphoribosylformylglycinamidine cyclo-ligase
MYQVFNMGHRMELYVPEGIASAIMQIAGTFGIGARVVGRVEEAEQASVVIHGPGGAFTYGKT